MKLLHLIWKIKSYIPFLQHERQDYLEFRTDADADFIYESMIAFGWQLNYIGYHDKGEVLNLRKLYRKRQLHFRLFDDGEARMHDELNYEFYPAEHLNGKEVYRVDKETILQLKEMIRGY